MISRRDFHHSLTSAALLVRPGSIPSPHTHSSLKYTIRLRHTPDHCLSVLVHADRIRRLINSQRKNRYRCPGILRALKRDIRQDLGADWPPIFPQEGNPMWKAEPCHISTLPFTVPHTVHSIAQVRHHCICPTPAVPTTARRTNASPPRISRILPCSCRYPVAANCS